MHNDEYYGIAEVEDYHWWYKSLHNLVLKNINKNFINNKTINIIDAGCGTGGLILFLKNNGYENIKGFDLSETAVKICKDKNLDVFQGNLKDIVKFFTVNSADVIISNDTFYFFDHNEQQNLADAINILLRKNGILITNMPSFNAFRGIHDLRVGINKRFSKKNIRNIFNNGKYELLTAVYWPFLLSPFIWMSRFSQRLKMRINKFTTIESDVKREAKAVNSLLYLITNIENRLLKKKPFGSSLFLVLKKAT